MSEKSLLKFLDPYYMYVSQENPLVWVIILYIHAKSVDYLLLIVIVTLVRAVTEYRYTEWNI